jgi:hypothetical protein
MMARASDRWPAFAPDRVRDLSDPALEAQAARPDLSDAARQGVANEQRRQTHLAASRARVATLAGERETRGEQ